MTCFDLKTWLTEFYPRMNWKHDFASFISPEVVKKAASLNHGFTFFVKGLNAEFHDKDAPQALEMYCKGAKYLDPLCLFRLHEIYLGNTFFGIEYNEIKSLLYLIWSTQFVLDLTIKSPISPVKKLVKFLTGFDKSGEYSISLVLLCDDPDLAPSKFIVRSLFQRNYFNNTDKKENEEFLISAVHALSFKAPLSAKNMFSMIHIGITRCYWATIKERKKARALLDILTKPDVIDNAFEFQQVLFEVCSGNDARLRIFRDWLAVFTFYWEYAFLSKNKASHLKYLCQISDTLIEKKMMKDEINIWWVKFYTGYSYEKGYLEPADETKALEIYNESIQSHERGLFPPLRKAILLKRKGEEDLADASFVQFRGNFLQRDQEDHPCFFNYVMGKAYEKYLDDEYEAILQYDKGARSEGKAVSEYLVMFNEYWRFRCEKRRDKLMKREKLRKERAEAALNSSIVSAD